jgi:hypothetical protein
MGPNRRAQEREAAAARAAQEAKRAEAKRKANRGRTEDRRDRNARQVGGRALWFHPTTGDHQQVTSAPQRAANFRPPTNVLNLRDRASVPGRRSRWRLFTIPCNRRAALDVR